MYDLWGIYLWFWVGYQHWGLWWGFLCQKWTWHTSALDQSDNQSRCWSTYCLRSGEKRHLLLANEKHTVWYWPHWRPIKVRVIVRRSVVHQLQIIYHYKRNLPQTIVSLSRNAWTIARHEHIQEKLISNHSLSQPYQIKNHST